MRLILSDTTQYALPSTLTLETVKYDYNYQEHRAPHSESVVVAGDGTPLVDKLVIKGTVYTNSSSDAKDWIFATREAIYDTDWFETDYEPVLGTKQKWAIDSGELIVVPNLLPRILNVTIRLIPSGVDELVSWDG